MIQSGVWNSRHLAYRYQNGSMGMGPAYTIMEALEQWYGNGTVVMFRDGCTQPHCNPQCPEEISLQMASRQDWPWEIKWAVIAMVTAIAVVCLVIKVSTCTCGYMLFSCEEMCMYMYIHCGKIKCTVPKERRCKP